mmetsp:Transcript_17394/g.40970  ORF Transcript_17394/g.40970 Transcript_17394/m.40970 type:complete len:96 (+) Transcript_17394:66-353(+)
MESTDKKVGESTVNFGNTKLARAQAHAHDLHAENMLRHHHRAMTGTIFGNAPDLANSSAALRASQTRLAPSSSLRAAGAMATAPVRRPPAASPPE